VVIFCLFFCYTYVFVSLLALYSVLFAPCFLFLYFFFLFIFRCGPLAVDVVFIYFVLVGPLLTSYPPALRPCEIRVLTSLVFLFFFRDLGILFFFLVICGLTRLTCPPAPSFPFARCSPSPTPPDWPTPPHVIRTMCEVNWAIPRPRRRTGVDAASPAAAEGSRVLVFLFRVCFLAVVCSPSLALFIFAFLTVVFVSSSAYSFHRLLSRFSCGRHRRWPSTLGLVHH